MPIHLPPISRRRFLAGSFGLSAAALLPHHLYAQEKAVDPHSFAILSDSHIAADRNLVKQGVNLTDNFTRAAAEVIALPHRPAAVLINGDLAVLKGEAKDYEVFVDLLRPLREAKIGVTLTLGNHDHRDNFFAAMDDSGTKAQAKAVEHRHVSLIESPRANWFLLDTLDQTNVTPGIIGEPQLKWLEAALDQHKDKPAIVMAHHTHEPGKPNATFGMKDTDALFALLLPRRQVKAFIHGHSHDYRYTQMQDLHIVGLPPTAYVFNASKPNGWIHLNLLDSGASLEMRALNPSHREHGRITELGWRTA